MILNPDNICLECGGPKKRPKAATCGKCNGTPKAKAGRKPTYTDEAIVEAIELYGNPMTLDFLLAALNLKSKTTLVKRLRKLRDAGLITLIERSRHDGFTIKAKQ